MTGSRAAGTVALPKVWDDAQRDAQQRVRNIVYVLRLTGAAAVVVLSPLVSGVPSSGRIAFALVVAGAYVPLVTVVQIASRRIARVPAGLDLLSAALDLGMIAVMAVTFEVALAFAMVITVLLLAFYTLVRGPWFGAILGVAGVAMVVALDAANLGAGDSAEATVALFPVAVVAIVLLQARVASTQALARADFDRVLGKAEALMTGVAEAVVVTSPRGRIHQWNHAAERALGCDERSAVGRSCDELLALRVGLGALDCSEGCALLKERLATDGDLQVWRDVPGANRQPLLANVSPILDTEGRVVEVVHSFRDITRLMEADEAKTLFLATATHELKTPLTVILGYAELMSRRPDMTVTDRDAGLDAIQHRARELSGIVDRLLLSSRIEAGRLDLNLEAVDVVPVTQERALALGDATARSIGFEMPDEVPPVLADRQALATVLDHLLENALKYSGPDGRVEISCTEGASAVHLVVEDDGIGMTEDTQRHCFERFWQGDVGDRRRYGGTGIGLYVVKSLVEAMGGDIAVASRLGVGTRFTLSLERADRRRVSRDDPVEDRRPGEPEPSIIREFMRQVGIPPGG